MSNQEEEREDQDPLESEKRREIEIEISDPVEKENKLKKYTVYTVKGVDQEGNFWVYRRYSDFHLLRQKMVSRWPGVFIASVPEKKAVGNMSPFFIEQRRQALNSFVNKIAQTPPLFYSDEFRIFLRAANDNFS